MNFDYPEGATPLDADEARGLLLSHITNRTELDRWEQENIAMADAWAFRRKPRDILSDGFCKGLHKRMFGTVWRWAGEFRTTSKNIGVPAWQITTELRNLCADCAAWIGHGTYPPDGIAVRFHHRLTAIHPFSNGNGRHARLMTDIILFHLLNRPRFSWGSGNLVDAGECRQQYINALRAADRHDYSQLLNFVRT
ncbi:MAG TPA: mobile mystery protein B [Deltaproteobacteria bacterium]|nr:mobile mystery protein B [Deltaproteobacteria bacterium]HQB39744.1 mobile mystery protein B [Deltaproteobacteria bacterium]